MSPDFNLLLAFTTGLFGALHCLGMCGGLAGGYFLQHRRPLGFSSQLLYHGGRLLLYTLLGIAGALAGRVLVQSGWIGKGQGLLMMAAGLIILLLGLRQLLDWARTGPARSGRAGHRHDSGRDVSLVLPSLTPGLTPSLTPSLTPGLTPGQLPNQFPGQLPNQPLGMPPGQLPGQPTIQPGRRPWPPLFLGMLNGLMPCGLVFALALKAAATADPAQAALLMLAFGLGTLPMMGALTSLAVWVGARSTAGILSGTSLGANARFRSLAAPILGGLVALMGLWTGYEGLIFFDIMRGLANG